MGDTIIWIHGDCLDPHGPAFALHPDAPAVFIWDDALLAEWHISLKRVVFIYESLLDLPVEIRRGDVASEVRRFAEAHGASGIVTAESPSPRFAAIVRELRKTHTLDTLPVAPFLDYSGKLDLRRFSRYWSVAERYVFDRTRPTRED